MVQPVVVLLAWCSLLWFCLIGGGGGSSLATRVVELEPKDF